jgi:hypothetical protein
MKQTPKVVLVILLGWLVFLLAMAVTLRFARHGNEDDSPTEPGRSRELKPDDGQTNQALRMADIGQRRIKTLDVTHRSVVYVGGEVARPGVYDLGDSNLITVARVIELAGGMTVFANTNRVEVRPRSGKVSVLRPEQWSSFELSPNDSVIISRRGRL